MPRYTELNDTELRVRIPQWMHAGLVAYAQKKRVSLATVVRWFAEEGLDRNDALPDGLTD